MLELEKLTYKNVWKTIKLHVSEKQDDFVATNTQSIIEAYIVTETYGGHAFPFAICNDGTPVGFLMIGYGVDKSYENPPKIAYDNYSIWRFMIDEKHQRKGYGKQALQLAIDFIKTFPCGKAEYCYLSYEPENEIAKKLYHSFGFRENGEIDDGETVAVLEL